MSKKKPRRTTSAAEALAKAFTIKKTPPKGGPKNGSSKRKPK